MAARPRHRVPTLTPEQLMDLRATHGLTKKRLARLIGREVTTVDLWERRDSLAPIRLAPVGGVAVLLSLIAAGGPSMVQLPPRQGPLQPFMRKHLPPEPGEMTPARVLAIRRKWYASRAALASAVNVSIDTVKAWEIKPNPARSRAPGRDTAILLALAERHGLRYLRTGRVGPASRTTGAANKGAETHA